jgi:hypothetical protein
MGILAGFHVEGWDHLILRSFVAALLGIAEDQIVPDKIDAPGRGWDFVLQNLDGAIQRFYNQCAQFAVLGVDNDGNEDLTRTGAPEDANRPRHWNHTSSTAGCRVCQIEAVVAQARSSLSPLPQKPPRTWPVLIVVPVETIEAWLLELRAIMSPPLGVVRAENRRRADFKWQLYGKPAAPRQDVERVALPLIRAAAPRHLEVLRTRSRSFDLFVAQVDANRATILGARDCWGLGDAGAER